MQQLIPVSLVPRPFRRGWGERKACAPAIFERRGGGGGAPGMDVDVYTYGSGMSGGITKWLQQISTYSGGGGALA